MGQKTARIDDSAGESIAPQGLLLVDKPAGMTSHDVVQQVRRIFGEKSIGHLGTLDPFATGLLVLLIGRATRLATFLEIEPKVYEAVIAFGMETDTDDATGTAIRTAALPNNEQVRSSVEALTGEISQVPPAYSAKSVDGIRAYDAARKGQPIGLPASGVRVHQWDVHKLGGGRLDVTITCSGGTYVRALARDVGRLSSSAAHLASLRRTRVGVFDVRDAATLEQLGNGPSRIRALRVVADD